MHKRTRFTYTTFLPPHSKPTCLATTKQKMPISDTFAAFFKGWLEHQQAFLDQLVDTAEHEDKNSSQLIEQVLSHYAEYYEMKAQVIWQDVFVAFSPPWLTPIEKTFLWVGGFKPSLTFCLAEVSNNSDMILEQVEKLASLKAETIWAEKNLVDALASVQESMGSPPLISLVKQYGRLVDGEVSEFADVIDKWKESMSRVLESADNLRRNTVIKVIEILNVKQGLKFLAVVAKYYLGIRAWGLQNDVQKDP